jgi:hypothetical protein
MTDRGRGGYRAPERPAATSIPQSGARTDGGAGSRTQPIRVAPGGRYGERAASVAQQQGAPLPAPPGPQPTGGVAGPPVAPTPPPSGVFGPSVRPQGVDTAASTALAPLEMVAQDPQMFARVLAERFPHPAIRRLVDWSAPTGPQGAQPPTPDVAERLRELGVPLR